MASNSNWHGQNSDVFDDQGYSPLHLGYPQPAPQPMMPSVEIDQSARPECVEYRDSHEATPYSSLILKFRARSNEPSRHFRPVCVKTILALQSFAAHDPSPQWLSTNQYHDYRTFASGLDANLATVTVLGNKLGTEPYLMDSESETISQPSNSVVLNAPIMETASLTSVFEAIKSPGNLPPLDWVSASTTASSPESVSNIATPKTGFAPLMEFVDHSAYDVAENNPSSIEKVLDIDPPPPLIGPLNLYDFPPQKTPQAARRRPRGSIDMVARTEIPILRDHIGTERAKEIPGTVLKSEIRGGPSCQAEIAEGEIEEQRFSPAPMIDSVLLHDYNQTKKFQAQRETNVLDSGGINFMDAVSCSEDETEEDDSSSIGRSPSPWLERWYDEGMTPNLAGFALKLVAEYTDNNDQDPDVNVIASCAAGDDGSQESTSLSFYSSGEQSNQSAGSGEIRLRKRSERDPNQGDDEDDKNEPKRQRIMQPPESYRQNLMYACPFQKRYPNQSPTCGLPHGAKQSFGWDSVSRVKQHIIESHGKDHHCPNCWKAFKKVDDAQRCKEKRNCAQRLPAKKIWLSGEVAMRLRAEKVQNGGDHGWYRLFGLLFPTEKEHGPHGFRAKYTPYYSMADESNKCSLLSPSSGVTPNSMWSPSTNPTPIGAESTIGMNGMPTGALVEDDAQATGSTFRDMFCELFPDLSHIESRSDDNGGTLAERMVHVDTFDVELALDSILNSNSVPTTAERLLNSGSSTISPTGDDAHSKSLLSRIKQRNLDLHKEIGALRGVIFQIRTTVEQQEQFIQQLDEQNLLPEESIGALWGYQDKLRKYVQVRV